MTDVAPELEQVKERIDKLAEMAGDDHSAEARKLAGEIKDELQKWSGEGQPANAGGPAPGARELRPPRETVLRCPRCTLHSFSFQSGSIREREDGAGYEARFHCMSCGFEDYAPIKPR